MRIDFGGGASPGGLSEKLGYPFVNDRASFISGECPGGVFSGTKNTGPTFCDAPGVIFLIVEV
jgi:hypothetical protein